MVGKIKGYSVCSISKGTLKKEDFFDEIKNKDLNVKEKIQNILSNHGIIYGLKKDKKLKAVYLFESITEDKKRILKFTEKILLEEINKEIQEEFEKDITEELSEFVSLEEYSKIVWDENVIVPKMVKVGKYNLPLGSLMFVVGVIFGILTDDLAMGMCIGICLGCGSAVIMKKKDNNENNNNNDNK